MIVTPGDLCPYLYTVASGCRSSNLTVSKVAVVRKFYNCTYLSVDKLRKKFNLNIWIVYYFTHVI